MQKYPRLALPTQIEFVNLRRPKSNFDLIEKRFDGLDPLRRIFSQVRQHEGKTMVLETLAQSVELAEEDDDIRRLESDFSGSTAYRLSFFKTIVRGVSMLASTRNKAFIGYVILKINNFASGKKSNVYESVLRPVPHKNSFIKGQHSWKITVAKRHFTVDGHLYAQQNGISNCCAHVALRTAGASFPNGQISFRRMNEIAGINLVTRRPGDGLAFREMVKILEAMGARCFAAAYRTRSKKKPPAPFQKYVYGSVESGYPAIISFETTRHSRSYHGIPVFGHTFNSDTWVPGAEQLYFRIGAETRYIPSESWVSMYIAHDDNGGSHFCIPRHYFQTQHPSSRKRKTVNRFTRECVTHVISTVPRDVQISPIRAEAIGVDYLTLVRTELPTYPEGNWSKRLRDYAEKDRLVLRPLLITAEQYAAHLSKVRDWHRREIRRDLIKALKRLSSEKLWMIELSVPELFSANFRKVGEVVVRAEKKLGSGRDMSGFLIARLPQYVALFAGMKKGAPSFHFLPSGAKDHVELFGCEDANSVNSSNNA